MNGDAGLVGCLVDRLTTRVRFPFLPPSPLLPFSHTSSRRLGCLPPCLLCHRDTWEALVDELIYDRSITLTISVVDSSPTAPARQPRTSPKTTSSPSPAPPSSRSARPPSTSFLMPSSACSRISSARTPPPRHTHPMSSSQNSTSSSSLPTAARAIGTD